MIPESPKPRLLLVEDDANLRFVTRDNLEQQGFQVTECSNGTEGWISFKNNMYDLCILDVMMPELDGFTLADQIRSLNHTIPIIFLTARGLKEDKLKAFSLGADDYVVKPFNMEELVMRIKVFLKRTGTKAIDPPLKSFRLQSIHFDYANYRLIQDDHIKTLTQKESDILWYLCSNLNKVVRREDLLLHVWGNDDYFTGRSLDVFISKIRKYLATEQRIKIVNYHGVGFLLSCPNEDMN